MVKQTTSKMFRGVEFTLAAQDLTSRGANELMHTLKKGSLWYTEYFVPTLVKEYDFPSRTYKVWSRLGKRVSLRGKHLPGYELLSLIVDTHRFKLPNALLKSGVIRVREFSSGKVLELRILHDLQQGGYSIYPGYGTMNFSGRFILKKESILMLWKYMPGNLSQSDLPPKYLPLVILVGKVLNG